MVLPPNWSFVSAPKWPIQPAANGRLDAGVRVSPYGKIKKHNLYISNEVCFLPVMHITVHSRFCLCVLLFFFKFLLVFGSKENAVFIRCDWGKNLAGLRY